MTPVGSVPKRLPIPCIGATNACCASKKARALRRAESRRTLAAALAHLMTPNEKGRDAVRIAAFGPFGVS